MNKKPTQPASSVVLAATLTGPTPHPHSIESEHHLLSAMMLDETGEAWAIAMQTGIRRATFYAPANQIIFDTIADLHKRGTPTSLDLVTEELRLRNQLDEIGGVAYLLQVSNATPTILNARRHAENLILLWQLRHTLTIATQLYEGVRDFNERDDFAKLCGDIGQRLIRFSTRTAPRTIAEQVDSVAADVLARATGQQDKSRWIHTGLPVFDRKLLPFGCAREDHFIILAGGSGHGKSAAMRQIAGHALLTGKRVLAYTRETNIEGFIEQLAASWCQIDLRNLEATPRDLLDAFAKKCAWLANEIADRRLWVVQHEDATPLLTIEDLDQHYAAFSNLHGHPDLVVVDYAQLFLTRRRCNNREQEVATVSHTLQSLCRKSGNVWLVGAQLNEKGLAEMRASPKRDAEGRIIHRTPNAGDLRESQALYHDADRCIVIYRPPEDSAQRDQTGPNAGNYPEQWLVQIKRRKGGLGYDRCIFEAPYTRFAEISREGTRADAAATQAAATPAAGMSKAQFLQQTKPTQTHE